MMKHRFAQGLQTCPRRPPWDLQCKPCHMQSGDLGTTATPWSLTVLTGPAPTYHQPPPVWPGTWQGSHLLLTQHCPFVAVGLWQSLSLSKPYYWLSICSAWGNFTWTLSPQVLVSLLWNELVRYAGKTIIAKEGWWFLSSGMSLISVQFKHSESLLIWLFQRVNWNHFYLTPLKEDSLDFKCSVRGKEERLLQSDIIIRPQLNIWVYQ